MSRGHTGKKDSVEVAPQESSRDADGDQVIMAGRRLPESLVANLATTTVQWVSENYAVTNITSAIVA